METPQNPAGRSVKIGEDERGGWSSDRPRRDGATRPPNIAVRCRLLEPDEELRYSPTSLLVITSGSKAARESFASSMVGDAGALLPADRVRGLLKSKFEGDELEQQTVKLLDATVKKRLQNGQPVAYVTDGLNSEERVRLARIAAAAKRPCHILLVEAPKDEIPEDDQSTVNELRRRLDGRALGEEGFVTALRLGGPALKQARRILFELPPRDD